MEEFPPFWPNNDPNLENGLPNHGMLYSFSSQFMSNPMVPFILTRKSIKKSCYPHLQPWNCILVCKIHTHKKIQDVKHHFYLILGILEHNYIGYSLSPWYAGLTPSGYQTNTAKMKRIIKKKRCRRSSQIVKCK